MNGDPQSKPPVEWKVQAAALGTYLGSVATLTVLQLVNSNLSLIGFLPDWLETIIIPLLPTAVAWAAAYRAKHTPRPDLPVGQR